VVIGNVSYNVQMAVIWHIQDTHMSSICRSKVRLLGKGRVSDGILDCN
jgi:hypothetical protein